MGDEADADHQPGMIEQGREDATRQKSYRLDCECKGTGRVKRYIGHPGRMAVFLCFACTDDKKEKTK